MAKTVKMCDMNSGIARKVFQLLNPDKILIKEDFCLGLCIYTDTEPKDLIYPEGWYYAKGTFRNKHQTKGQYSEIQMFKTNGERWNDFARYCTLD